MSKENNIVPELRFPKFEKDKWVKTNIGSIGKPLMCKRIFKEQTTTDAHNTIPFFKIGTFGKEADAYIPFKLYEEYKEKYPFPNTGDILISASGTIGRLVVYDGVNAYFQDSNIVWIGNDETQITNSLLFYCYSTLVWQTSDGGIIKRLYNSNLKEMEIYFPKSKQEQQKIANCLSSLDTLITAETDKLANLKDHKKGLLQQLFPANGETKPQYRFPEFINDGDWEEKTIDELGRTISGLRGKKGDDFGSGKPYVTYKQVFGNSFVKFKDCAKVKVSKSENQNILTKGDILFTTSSETPHEVGFASVLIEEPDETTYLNSFCFALRPNDLKELLPNFSRFLFHCKIYRNKVTLIAQGSTRFNLSKGHFIKLKLRVPNPKEQQKIANCLSSADDLIATQKTKIKSLKKHKKGLMQQLFPNTI